MAVNDKISFFAGKTIGIEEPFWGIRWQRFKGGIHFDFCWGKHYGRWAMVSWLE